MSGALWLVATPIGNLGDMTPRALEALSNADVIAAEDTRRTLKLLNHFQIKKPLVSYREHNKRECGPRILAMLKDGRNVALVTDAGMPSISDPGEDLVRLCHENGVSVTVMPGPSAFAAALALSGMSSRRFAFEGFLPRGKRERRAVLDGLKAEGRTVILYEAPHHLCGTLADLFEALGERRLSLVREITKLHEETAAGTLSGFLDYYKTHEARGEYVMVIEGAGGGSGVEPENADESADENSDESVIKAGVTEEIEARIRAGLSKKEAMKCAAKARGVPKREVYARYLKESGPRGEDDS